MTPLVPVFPFCLVPDHFDSTVGLLLWLLLDWLCSPVLHLDSFVSTIYTPCASVWFAFLQRYPVYWFCKQRLFWNTLLVFVFVCVLATTDCDNLRVKCDLDTFLKAFIRFIHLNVNCIFRTSQKSLHLQLLLLGDWKNDQAWKQTGTWLGWCLAACRQDAPNNYYNWKKP